MNESSGNARSKRIKRRTLPAVAMAVAVSLAISIPASAYAAGDEPVYRLLSSTPDRASQGVADNASSSSEGGAPSNAGGGTPGIAAGGGSSSAAEEPAKAGAADPVKAAISKEAADKLARELLHIPVEYKLTSSSYSTSRFGTAQRSIWYLNYEQFTNNKRVGTINVGIDGSSGELVQYNTYLNDPTRTPTYPPAVDRDAAEALALDFIRSISPQYSGAIELDAYHGAQLKPPLDGQVRYLFRYNRMVSGIPYKDNYIELELDTEGHVLQYRVVWDSAVQFEQDEPAFDEAEARAKLLALADPKLAYIMPYNGEGKNTPYLAYMLEPFMIDAVTGEVWDNIARQQPTPNLAQPVTARPLAASTAETGAKALTSEQAAAIVEKQFALPEVAELVESNYNEYTDSRSGKLSSRWHLGWQIPREGKNQGNVWASVDSLTGTITNYSHYDSQREQEGDAKPISYEAAEAAALETIKQLLPAYTHQLYLQPGNKADYEGKPIEEIYSYRFSFQRVVNGAVVTYDGASIAIHPRTGEVMDYYSEIAPVSYPTRAPATIGKQAAAEAWLDNYRLELSYVLPLAIDGQPLPIEKYLTMVAAGEAPPVDAGSKAKLAYRLVARALDEQVFLDARTGQWRNRSTGEPTELEAPAAADIAGHWAERELALMVAYKALDLEDGQVRPNRIIKRGELIKMLVLAMNSFNRPYSAFGQLSMADSGSFTDVKASSDYFIYVESAVQQNLIDRGDGTFNPEGEVGREEMAELIVRALGYNPLAQYKDIFNISFQDADHVEQQGQVAIVLGLGIMSLNSKGDFQPERLVTRAEAAAAFSRFLAVRAGLQEAPLRN